MDPDAAGRYVRSIASRDVATGATGVQAVETGQTAASGTPSTGSPSGSGQAATGLSGSGAVAATAAASNPATPPVVASIVSGLTLTDWEVQALETFAAFVGTTPRRAIRFVNLYRLIKTSLPPGILEKLVGEGGESHVYGALIAQLAIVTGAPEAAAHFFTRLAEQKAGDSLLSLRTTLSSDAAFDAYPDAELVRQILETLQQRGANGSGFIGAQFVAGDLQALALTARRYSFATPPR
jgi:hypothetical protein